MKTNMFPRMSAMLVMGLSVMTMNAAALALEAPPDPGVDNDRDIIGAATGQVEVLKNANGEPPRSEKSDRVGVGLIGADIGGNDRVRTGASYSCENDDIDMPAPSNDNNTDDTDNGFIHAAAA